MFSFSFAQVTEVGHIQSCNSMPFGGYRAYCGVVSINVKSSAA